METENSSIEQAKFLAQHIGSDVYIRGSGYSLTHWGENVATLVGVEFDGGYNFPKIILKSKTTLINGGLILLDSYECKLIRKSLFNMPDYDLINFCRIIFKSENETVALHNETIFNITSLTNTPVSRRDSMIKIKVNFRNEHIGTIDFDREEFYVTIHTDKKHTPIEPSHLIEGLSFLKSKWYIIPYNEISFLPNLLRVYNWVIFEDDVIVNGEEDIDLPF